MKLRLLYGWLSLLLVAAGVFLSRGYPMAHVAPVRLVWPTCGTLPLPPVALLSVRTMNETAFFKVLGVLHNRGVAPVGPVVVRGRFTSRSNGAETAAMSFTTPEIIVPGGAARFELVALEHPETARVDLDFRLLSGERLSVDGTQATIEGKRAP